MLKFVAVCCSVLQCVANVPVAAAVVVVVVDWHSALANSVCIVWRVVWCVSARVHVCRLPCI